LSNNVTVIDGATNRVNATLADPKAKSPYAIGMDPTNHRVYVANSASANVTVIAGAQ
jgi:DNA-binding beta-propeller fold protein YncE